LLILELIRNISFNTAERLFSNHDFIKGLFASIWAEKSFKEDQGEALGGGKWVPILKETVAQVMNDEQVDQDELLKMFNSLTARTTALTQVNFEYWVRLGSNPPSLTWKEFYELIKKWEENPSANGSIS
jgi:hypothetical protein